MRPKPIITCISIALLLLPLIATAQKKSTTKSASKTAVDPIMMKSTALVFKQASFSTDTAKATLRVQVHELGNTEPIQGATVLLHRDKDKMLGKVTKHDGRCLFVAAPATYTVRVQMTGLNSFEKPGFTLESGKVYDMEIAMARN